MPSSPLRTFFLRMFIVLLFAAILFPFVWAVLISLQTTPEINSALALLLPRSLQIDNYLSVLRNSQYLKGLFNSLVISLLSVGINLIISVPAGYALARVKTRLSRLISCLLLMFVFVPVSLLALPLRELLQAMNLSGTHMMVALPLSAVVMTTVIFRMYYSTFPAEMDDCAVLLGMTPVQSFIRIYLPVSGRMLAYAAILQFVTTWNCAFLPAFMYRGPSALMTVQEAMLQFTLVPSRIYLGMVAVVFTCLPCWLLYILRDKISRPARNKVADPFRNSN